MQPLNSAERSDRQIWGSGFMHVMNISDEVVTGMEGLEGNTASVGGVATTTYKLRPLGTLSPENALAVPEKLYHLSTELNRYHRSIGVNDLPTSHIVPIHCVDQFGYSGAIVKTCDDLRKRLDAIGVNRITAFIESRNIHTARHQLGFHEPIGVDAQVVDSVNNKGVFLGTMSQIGVPTAFGRTLFTEDSAWECFREIQSMGAKTAYAKLGRAASGQGVFPISCLSSEDFEQFLSLPQTQNQLNTIGIRLDYGIENIVDSPNVMILVGKNQHNDRFISASSQLLAKRNPSDERPTVHKGNISGLNPKIQEKLVSYSQKVADWMRSIGAYGIVGLDYIVTEKGDIYIMEANYRVNGGLAAAMKGHDLKSPYWAASGAIRVPNNTSLQAYVAHLQSNKIEFNGKEGIVVLNSATSASGTIQAGIYGTTKQRILEIMQGADMT